jgi:hypothetical protein
VLLLCKGMAGENLHPLRMADARASAVSPRTLTSLAFTASSSTRSLSFSPDFSVIGTLHLMLRNHLTNGGNKYHCEHTLGLEKILLCFTQDIKAQKSPMIKSLLLEACWITPCDSENVCFLLQTCPSGRRGPIVPTFVERFFLRSFSSIA